MDRGANGEMDRDEQEIDRLLQELHRSGVQRDEQTQENSRKLRNITPSTGRFLELLIEEERPQRILELGTSNGYSTIWVGRAAAAVAATVDSVDQNVERHQEARQNLAAAGLSQCVRLHTQEIGEFLVQNQRCQYDMIFLDTDRKRYAEWWPLVRQLWTGKIIVCDNATSHPDEFQPLLSILEQDSWLDHGVLTVGRGLLLVRQRTEARPAGAFVSLGLPGQTGEV